MLACVFSRAYPCVCVRVCLCDSMCVLMCLFVYVCVVVLFHVLVVACVVCVYVDVLFFCVCYGCLYLVVFVCVC